MKSLIGLLLILFSLNVYASNKVINQKENQIVMNTVMLLCDKNLKIENTEIVKKFYTEIRKDCTNYYSKNNLEDISDNKKEEAKRNMFFIVSDYISLLNDHSPNLLNTIITGGEACEICKEDPKRSYKLNIIKDIVRDFCYSEFTQEQYIELTKTTWSKIENICSITRFNRFSNKENEINNFKNLLKN